MCGSLIESQRYSQRGVPFHCIRIVSFHLPRRGPKLKLDVQYSKGACRKIGPSRERIPEYIKPRNNNSCRESYVAFRHFKVTQFVVVIGFSAQLTTVETVL